MYKFILRNSHRFNSGAKKLAVLISLILFSTSIFAQTNPTIRFSSRNTTIARAFVEISKQTGLGFTHDQGFNTSKNIALPKNTLNLSEVMATILDGTNLDYTVYNKVVIIRQKQSDTKRPAVEQPLERINTIKQTLAGTVSVIGSSIGLENADVAIEGQVKLATKTDSKGLFRLEQVPVGEYTIRISHNSYGSIQYQISIAQGRDESVLIALNPKQTVIVPFETPAPGFSENKLPIRSLLNYTTPSQNASMPRWAIKSNLLYDATTTLNIGFEFRLSDRLTMDIPLNWNPWAPSFEKNKQIRHYMIQPELRYWINEPFNRHFTGAHLHYAHFNISNINMPLNLAPVLKQGRVQGDMYGLGFSYGYQWILSKRINLEATMGIGYFYAKYSRYDCDYCGNLIARENKHYIGPTKAGLSLIYIIK